MTNELKTNLENLDRVLHPERSFDLVKRDLIIGERNAVLYFIDGFIKDEVFEKILEFFYKITPDELLKIRDMDEFLKVKIPYVEAESLYENDRVVTQILSGPAMLLIDGIEGALALDTRAYPTRGIKEPQKDKTLRGSRDGFVETLIFNTAMIRRRIRDPRLTMEYIQVGSESKVDLAISYLDGEADEKTLAALRRRLKQIKLKSISMTQEALAESLIRPAFLNPFPRYKFTERPDYTSAAIMEGKIVLVMDNSPCVMILPTTFADFFRETDDYYFLPLAGTYTRIIRAAVAFLTVFLPPLYLLAANDARYLPGFLTDFAIAGPIGVSLFAQFILLELVIDGLKLASLNTPDNLTNSLGIIGGLLLSEFAVNAGWFNGESIMVMAFVAISSYAQPSYEMGYAMKFERLALLILTQIFGLWGLIAGAVIFFVLKLCTKTLTGRNYLYPLIPFNLHALIHSFVRPNIRRNH